MKKFYGMMAYGMVEKVFENLAEAQEAAERNNEFEARWGHRGVYYIETAEFPEATTLEEVKAMGSLPFFKFY